jgi:hypothetical protein
MTGVYVPEANADSDTVHYGPIRMEIYGTRPLIVRSGRRRESNLPITESVKTGASWNSFGASKIIPTWKTWRQSTHPHTTAFFIAGKSVRFIDGKMHRQHSSTLIASPNSERFTSLTPSRSRQRLLGRLRPGRYMVPRPDFLH